MDIWWALPADRRDDFQAAVNERALAERMALDGRYEQAAVRYVHCMDVLRRARGSEDATVALAGAGHAWALMHLGRADQAEQEAREALAVSERLRPPGQTAHWVQYCLGSILVARGQLDEAEQLLLSVWEGDHGLPGVKDRAAPDRWRARLAEDMLAMCMARQDTAGEVRWRQEVAAAK